MSRELELTEVAPLPGGESLTAVGLERLIGPFRRGAVPEAAEETGFYTDTTVCIGCKACEVACKQWNQLPADGFTFSGNSYDNTGALSAESWRHVKFVEQFSVWEAGGGDGGAMPGRWLMMSDTCKHCVEAPCQHACPTGAIIHNEFNNVYIQPDICNGCAYCIAACPFGVITRSTLDNHAHKCTLCYDRQKDGLVPACAKACPTASIQFGPVEELRLRARTRVEELHRRGVADAWLYGHEPTEDYSRLNAFYLLLDRASVYGLPEAPRNPWLTMRGDYLRAVLSVLPPLAVLITALLRGR